MEHFWPSLPLLVPASQGIPFWFDIVAWVFQIVIMVTIIWLVTRWALKMERELGDGAPANRPIQSGTSNHLES